MWRTQHKERCFGVQATFLQKAGALSMFTRKLLLRCLGACLHYQGRPPAWRKGPWTSSFCFKAAGTCPWLLVPPSSPLWSSEPFLQTPHPPPKPASRCFLEFSLSAVRTFWWCFSVLSRWSHFIVLPVHFNFRVKNSTVFYFSMKCNLQDCISRTSNVILHL